MDILKRGCVLDRTGHRCSRNQRIHRSFAPGINYVRNHSNWSGGSTLWGLVVRPSRIHEAARPHQLVVTADNGGHSTLSHQSGSSSWLFRFRHRGAVGNAFLDGHAEMRDPLNVATYHYLDAIGASGGRNTKPKLSYYWWGRTEPGHPAHPHPWTKFFQ